EDIYFICIRQGKNHISKRWPISLLQAEQTKENVDIGNNIFIIAVRKMAFLPFPQGRPDKTGL
ncbi:MAG: hypothetical protein PHF84_03990, partial [bacterium]|nr:hypothetical protein [bacterium]